MTNQLTYHLVPTSDTTNLFIYDGDGQMYCDKEARLRTGGTKGDQHLYLCSTKSSKPGDFVIDIEEGIEKPFSDYMKGDNRYIKVEATTNNKINGVIIIYGNTKATYENDKEQTFSKEFLEVNFLEEFCKRWNEKERDIQAIKRLEEVWGDDKDGQYAELYKQRQKDTKKVDVEELAETYIKNGKDFKAEGFSEYQNGKMNGFVDGYNQALQSTGQYSLEDMRKAFSEGAYYHSNWHMFNQLIQSLTPQPKGETVIEYSEGMLTFR